MYLTALAPKWHPGGSTGLLQGSKTQRPGEFKFFLSNFVSHMVGGIVLQPTDKIRYIQML